MPTYQPFGRPQQTQLLVISQRPVGQACSRRDLADPPPRLGKIIHASTVELDLAAGSSAVLDQSLEPGEFLLALPRAEDRVNRAHALASVAHLQACTRTVVPADDDDRTCTRSHAWLAIHRLSSSPLEGTLRPMSGSSMTVSSTTSQIKSSS